MGRRDRVGQAAARWEFPLWGVGGCVALAVWLALYPLVFPAATVGLRISGREASQVAARFLAANGWPLDDLRPRVTFGETAAGRYLERQLGPREAARLAQREVLAWRFSCRWREVGGERSYAVDVDPAGSVAGFDLRLPVGAAGATLTEAAAGRKAWAFAQQHYQGRVSDLRLVYRKHEQRSRRSDWVFVWDDRSFRAGQGRRCCIVGLAGSRVCRWATELRLPPAWIAQQSATKTARRVLVGFHRWADLILYLALAGVLVHCLGRGRHCGLGAACVVGAPQYVLAILAALNSLPVDWRVLPDETASSLSSALSELFRTSNEALGWLLVAAAAAVLVRLLRPAELPWSRALCRDWWHTAAVRRALLVGVAAAAAMLCYQALFYLLAFRCGAWAPQHQPAIAGIGTPLPWIEVLRSGVCAATREELLYRVGAMALLWRLTQRRWLTLLLPALVWALGHAHYPQEPCWIRVLELTLAGLGFGLVAWRYGVLATLTAHCGCNVLLGAQPLLWAAAPSLQLAGALAIGLWLAVPLWVGAAWLRRRPASDPALLRAKARSARQAAVTGASEALAAPQPAVPVVQPGPLAPWAWGVAATMAGVGLALALSRPPPRLGAELRCGVLAREAVQRADDYLQHLGVDLSRFDRSARPQPALDDRYDWLVGEVGQAVHDGLVQRYAWAPTCWRVSYFEPGQPEWYAVWVDGVGRVRHHSQHLPPTVGRPSLSQAVALAAARRWLQQQQGESLDGWTLLSAETVRRLARVDHTFRWQRAVAQGRRSQVGASQEVTVCGTTVVWDPPWLHRAEAATLAAREEQAGYELAQMIGGGLLILSAVLLLAASLGPPELVPWRSGLACGGRVGLLAAGCLLLVTPASWFACQRSYPEAASSLLFWQHLLDAVPARLSEAACLVAAAAGLGVLTAATHLRWCPGSPPLAGWLAMRSVAAADRPISRCWSQAVWFGGLLAVAACGLPALTRWIEVSLQACGLPWSDLAVRGACCLPRDTGPTVAQTLGAAAALGLAGLCTSSLRQSLWAGRRSVVSLLGWTWLLAVNPPGGRIGVFWEHCLLLMVLLPGLALWLMVALPRLCGGNHAAYGAAWALPWWSWRATVLVHDGAQSSRTAGLVLFILLCLPLAVTAAWWWRHSQRTAAAPDSQCTCTSSP